jgi:ankyrin repeat protein
MKRLRYIIGFAFGINLVAVYAMELFQAPTGHTSYKKILSNIRDQHEQAYTYIVHNKLIEKYTAEKYAILEAILNKDITEVTRILQGFPPEGLCALLNLPIDLNRYTTREYPLLTQFAQTFQEDFTITPLCLAIYNDQPEMMQLLHTFNADVNAPTRQSYPVAIAVKYNPKCIKFLADHGAALNHAPKGLPPIFMTAYKGGRLDSAQALIQAGASLNVRFPLFEATPLHVACNNGQYEVARYFLEQGADVEASDIEGITPLLSSVEASKYNIHLLLLEYGANILARSNRGESIIEFLPPGLPLAAAELLRYGAPYPESAEFKALADRGIAWELGASTPFYQNYVTALIQNNTTEAINRIKAACGDELNTAYSIMDNLTPLHWAVIRGNSHVVSTLIQLRKKENSRAHTFTYNLTHSLPIISQTMQRPVDLNPLDDNNRTPLIWAGRLGHTEIYRELVQAGARRDIKDTSGKTAQDHLIRHLILQKIPYDCRLI